MSIEWLAQNAKGESAARSGDWKAAEKRFRRAVVLSASEEPLVQAVSMVDHAIALRMLGKVRASLRVLSAARTLATQQVGFQHSPFAEVVAMCDAFAYCDLPFEPRRLYLNKRLGKLHAEGKYPTDGRYHN